MSLILCYSIVNRTMNRLTQLERLDLGSNEFTEVVSPHLSHQSLFSLAFVQGHDAELKLGETAHAFKENS